MKKRIAIVATLVCALAVCAAFVGCKKVDTTQYVGSWTMTEGVVEGSTFTPADIDLLKANGVTVKLTIEQGGTFELALKGDDEPSSGTWTAEKKNLQMKDKIGTTFTATVQDGVLTLADGTGKNDMKFSK